MNRFIAYRRFSVLTLFVLSSALFLMPAKAADKPLEKVSVRLNWVPGAEHGFFYMGKAKGWFASKGIDLEIIAGSGSTVSVTTVGSGSTDFALADGASVARGWEVGVPIVVMSVLLKESPASIYSRKSAGIARITDLCGKRVGINLKSTTAAQYRAMIGLAKLPADCKIEEVSMSGGGSREVLSNTVDAAVTFSYEDPVLLTVRGNEMNEIIASSFFKLYSLGLITNQTLVTKKRDLVDRFMKATNRSLEYAIANPKEGLDSFLKVAPEANVDYEREKLARFNKLLIADDASTRSLAACRT